MIVRRRAARFALAIVIAPAGVLASATMPASAATTVQGQALAATVDCSSLQGGMYTALHVTGSFTGLGAGATYTAGLSTGTGAQLPVTADSTGSAVLDMPVTGQFAASKQIVLTLRTATTNVYRAVLTTSACASGVSASGQLTADTVCAMRYLSDTGAMDASSFHAHGTLTGFVPGLTYWLQSDPSSPQFTAVADATGALTFDFTFTGSATALTTQVWTGSQGVPVAQEAFALGDPCPALVQAPKPARLRHDGDINGDGLGDLLAVDKSGRLLLYKNGSRTNPGGLPFSNGTVIGSGWGYDYGASPMAEGDLTGDGYGEVIARRPDGTLLAYYNNMGSNPGHLPYTTGTVIGTGWNAFWPITLADVNGDGYADILAENYNGTTWLYLNHYRTNPAQPFTTGVQLPAAGIHNLDGFQAGDLNGDGYADLIYPANWVDPNRTAAGGSPFAQTVPLKPETFSADAGWTLGDYDGSGKDGMLIANPFGDGTLRYVTNPMEASLHSGTVIGSGWQTIYQIIS